MRIRHLRNAGYKFQPNDMSVEEWRDLGSLEEVMKERSDMRMRDLLIQGICTAFRGGRG